MNSDTERVYDEFLVTLARDGDRKAFERLAARWQPRLLSTARRLLRDNEQAREAVQETWTGICRRLQTLNDPGRFPAWVFSILHRKCTDIIRKTSRDRNRTTSLLLEHTQGKDNLNENLNLLDQAFATLSPDHREVATLFFGEGLTLSEIASATHVSTGTVKSRIFYARRKLKAAITGDDNE